MTLKTKDSLINLNLVEYIRIRDYGVEVSFTNSQNKIGLDCANPEKLLDLIVKSIPKGECRTIDISEYVGE